MNALSLPTVHPMREAGPLVLRALAGIIIGYHGWQKLDNGVAGFAGFVDSLGIPLPTLTAWVVTLLELGGGILLILGLLSRIVGGLLVLEMIGTTTIVKLDVGLIAPQGGGAGAEIDLALMAAFAAVLFMGPGRFSLDHVLGIEGERQVRSEGRPAAERKTPTSV